MVIGQDWGDVGWFQHSSGQDVDNSDTDKTLINFLASIGYSIDLPSKSQGRGLLFFTNAILCLKKGGAAAAVRTQWFLNCGTQFLKQQIEIVQPKSVVCMGQWAYETVLRAYGLQPLTLRQAVDSHQPTILPNGSAVFAVYHCTRRIRYSYRTQAEQRRDWQIIGEWTRSHNQG